MTEETTMQGLGMRVFHMLVFGVAFWILCWVLAATAVVQLVLRLARGAPAPDLQRFGASLARYAGQIVAFLTFASDSLPFPFGEWPDVRRRGEPGDLSTL